MNILIFTVAFHPSIGGLENQTLKLAYEFIRMGHFVKVITMQFPAITITSCSAKLTDIEVYYKPGIVQSLKLFLWCNTLYMPNISLRGVWLLFMNPFKRWVISHNDFYLKTSSYSTRLKLFLIKFASSNIAVSKSVANYLNTRSTIIYNCYDDEIFKIYKEEKRLFDFVFLGRLVTQKGCDILIKACSNLGTPFTLNIIGEGPEKVRLQQMVEKLGLVEHVKFVGMLQGQDLARFLNRHKTMIIPSIGEEGFGIVALEGMACGCRIIAADAGGLPEAVNGLGKIFAMNDREGLENLLKEDLIESNKSYSNNLTPHVNDHLKEHKRESIAKKYLYLFR